MPNFALPLPLGAVALLLISVSACQPISTDAADNKTQNWSCQTQDALFSYSVCSIDAQALMNGHYSLKLFWQQPDSTKSLLTFDTLLATLPSNQALNFA